MDGWFRQNDQRIKPRGTNFPDHLFCLLPCYMEVVSMVGLEGFLSVNGLFIHANIVLAGLICKRLKINIGVFFA